MCVIIPEGNQALLLTSKNISNPAGKSERHSSVRKKEARSSSLADCGYRGNDLTAVGGTAMGCDLTAVGASLASGTITSKKSSNPADKPARHSSVYEKASRSSFLAGCDYGGGDLAAVGDTTMGCDLTAVGASSVSGTISSKKSTAISDVTVGGRAVSSKGGRSYFDNQ